MQSARRGYLLLLLLAVLLPGCGDAPTVESDGRLPVVATTGMVADVARRVGGEHVRVEGLMGPGIDPHLYKASEGDVRRLWRARLILYNGLHLEARMADVLARMNERTPTVAVAERIDRARLLSPAGYEDSFDPHIWFDVRLWSEVVIPVRDALTRVDPARGEIYAANAEQYLAELEQLDRYVRGRVQELPAERRVLITAHDAFHYFGEAYGFEVRGLQGISTASEAGTADVQALAVLIAERRIPAVFVESSVPRRTIEAVRAAVRARDFDVSIGGELYSDALGAPDGPAGSYVGMVRHNIDTIVDALLGRSGETT